MVLGDDEDDLLERRSAFYVRVGPNDAWHVEGPDVDTMLCGAEIAVDGLASEVRTRRPVRVCHDCDEALAERKRRAALDRRVAKARY